MTKLHGKSEALLLCQLLLLYSATTIPIIAVNRFWAHIPTGEQIKGVENGRDCRAHTGSCPYPSKTKEVLSPCLLCTTGLGPATQTASSSSKCFQASASPLEAVTTGSSLEGLWKETVGWGRAGSSWCAGLESHVWVGMLCFGESARVRLSSCQRLGESSTGVSCRYRSKRGIYQKKARSKTSDLHVLMHFGEWCSITSR